MAVHPEIVRLLSKVQKGTEQETRCARLIQAYHNDGLLLVRSGLSAPDKAHQLQQLVDALLTGIRSVMEPENASGSAEKASGVPAVTFNTPTEES